ncbi:DoxX family protein [Nocardiopsis potens]|uniref:hypothetical protein n=1 Tax=Nocardiopsis potens TaxID=1246458 RepID=UPI0003488F8D|nr:hypothetical protein [Nocardiopsis potens]
MTDFAVPALTALTVPPMDTLLMDMPPSLLPAEAGLGAPLAMALGCFLGTAGLCHFAFRRYFRSLVPSWLAPVATPLVLVSGVVEILLAALLFIPETRAPAAWGAAALITGYLVSHFDAVARADRDAQRFLDRPAGGAARVAVNLVYIAWAVAAAVLA